jgi:hypothetical protein
VVKIDMAKAKTMKRHKAQLRGMTAIERAMGRFMRAPDGHEAAAGGEAGAEESVKVEASAEGDGDETTILGGDGEGEAGATEGAEEGKGDGEAGAAEGPPEAYDLTAPEGVTLDAETLADADPVFRELGLSNEAANKLIPLATKFSERIAAQTLQANDQAVVSEVIAQRKAWATEAKADAEIGGANWDQTVELSAKALDALGYPKGSPFRTFLTDTGLGNHPEMIRAMRRVGNLVGEDGDFVRGDTGAAVKQPREAVLYPDDVRKEGAA